VIEATSARGTITLTHDAVAHLRTRLTGPLLTPTDSGYDAARTIWNRLIDRRPALIARCASADDVAAGVHFAREHELLLSVRGGGHNVAGSAICHGGLMLDLSAMKTADVDASRRTVVAGPGLTWGELDTATQRHGLATVGGIISTTGVAGLTLGGGHGWLMRKYGLTCDNLLAADLVTADGRRLRTSRDEHPDLFWALRGGGGNFGIVTAFEFRLHPVTTVTAGLLVFPTSRGREVVEVFRTLSLEAPDELTVHVLMTTWFDGTPVIAVALCYCGPEASAEAVLRPLRTLGAPMADTIRRMSYGELQTSLDSTNPAGGWYYKSGYFDPVRGRTSEALLATLDHVDFPDPSILSRVVIEGLGGAMARVPDGETAFVHRRAPFDLIVIAGGITHEQLPRNAAWARGVWTAMKPFLSGGIYVNYLDGDQGHEGVEAAYGPAYARLAALKAKYDPDNVFRLNHNITPQGAARAEA
jgi:FAD/FMN-containing dehydrogenase